MNRRPQGIIIVTQFTKLNLLSGLLVFFLSSQSHADNLSFPKDYSAIPVELIENIYPTQTMAEFIDDSLKWAFDHHIINTSIGIPPHLKEYADKIEEHQEELVLQFDHNKNGRVTIDEVKHYPVTNPNQLEQYSMGISLLKRLDQNQDREVSPDEMKVKAIEYIEELRNKRTDKYEIATILDLNNDKIVSIEELKDSSRRIFSLIDINKNDTLDESEIKTLAQHSTTKIMKNKRVIRHEPMKPDEVKALVDSLEIDPEKIIITSTGNSLQAKFEPNVTIDDYLVLIDRVKAQSSHKMRLSRFCIGKNCPQQAILFEGFTPPADKANPDNVDKGFRKFINLLTDKGIDFHRISNFPDKKTILIEVQLDKFPD